MKFLTLVLSLMFLAGCGVQSIPMAKNDVEAKFAEVSNQYKRRADLIPNLVKVVKGYASHEKETLEAVINARSKATQTTIDPSNIKPEQIQAFMQNQGALTSALSRLMVVVERYPDLKANENFRDLQVQLEGTENRITIARQRYIDSIKSFNDKITVPPESITNMFLYKYEKMPQWDVSAEEKEKIEKAPTVEF